jgi:transposase
VDALLDRGIAVYALNPKQLDRFRDRHSVAGAKDDRRDAFVLATSLVTDEDCFHQTRVQDGRIVQLRELTRLHEDLGAERVALGNRLRDQLLRYYPQVLELGSVYGDTWIWKILDLAPSPAAAKKLSRAKLVKVLKEHRIRRLTADEVLRILRAGALVVAPGVTAAATRHIASLLPRLRIIDEQLRDCSDDMKRLLDNLGDASAQGVDQKVEPRDVQVVRSLPGVGTYVGATLLAEASSALQSRDYHALRGLAGVAPVTKATGKRSKKLAKIGMRRACNESLRDAVFYWAFASLTRDPRAKALYARLRARGHNHARALRGLGDRLLAMLVAMLRAGTVYDPARRQIAA